MSKETKWSLIRIGTGDYALTKGKPLYKEIILCAQRNSAVSATAYKSIDGFLMKGSLEVVRLFGGVDKSQGLIIEVLIRFNQKENFLEAVRELAKSTDDPIIISASDSDIEVFGIE
jgi:PII-like signaling protein